MKKKWRDIQIGQNKYTWSVSNVNGDGDGGFRVKIWLDCVEIYNEFLSGVEQPGMITPRWVAKKIEEINS
jgi:hypothetical protein